MRSRLFSDFSKFTSERLARAFELVGADENYKNILEESLSAEHDLITVIGEKYRGAVDKLCGIHNELSDITAEYSYYTGFQDALKLLAGN